MREIAESFAKRKLQESKPVNEMMINPTKVIESIDMKKVEKELSAAMEPIIMKAMVDAAEKALGDQKKVDAFLEMDTSEKVSKTVINAAVTTLSKMVN